METIDYLPIKLLRKIQTASDMRKLVSGMNENFTKTEIVKNHQVEIFKMKSSISEIKNTTETPYRTDYVKQFLKRTDF